MLGSKSCPSMTRNFPDRRNSKYPTQHAAQIKMLYYVGPFYESTDFICRIMEAVIGSRMVFGPCNDWCLLIPRSKIAMCGEWKDEKELDASASTRKWRRAGWWRSTVLLSPSRPQRGSPSQRSTGM